MKYLALYRKYRPINFNDVVGQDKVVQVIRNAITHNRISHAYLFSGPRGTGKTTTAKIIARMVNCQNLSDDGCACGECECCKSIFDNNDVVEIDAASNNGVDEIRELRDKVNLVPTVAKYKVYIIDEVHMLTIQAFNALLKTLEEPPSHVIFILATTEPHKIPMTIASRCQKFQFTKIGVEYIVKRLSDISKLEDISIDKSILYEIARLSDGGMRDAISLMDQLISYKDCDITIDDVYKINGTVSYKDIYRLLTFILNNDKAEIISFVDSIDNMGKNILRFVNELIIYLRDVLIYQNCGKLGELEEKNDQIKEVAALYKQEMIYDLIISLNDLLNRMKTSSYPALLLQICLFRVIDKKLNIVPASDKVVVNNESERVVVKKDENKTSEMVNNVGVVDKNKPVEKLINDNENFVSKSVNPVENLKFNVMIDENIKKIRINNTFVSASKTFKMEVKDKWNLIKNYLLSSKYGVVAGLLNDVEAEVVGENNMILLAKYESLANRINEVADEVSLLLQEIFNKNYLIVCLDETGWKEVRQSYIDNLKKGYKYCYIAEDCQKGGEVEKGTSAARELIELVGSDVIEYR